MNNDIKSYNDSLSLEDKNICEQLASLICKAFPNAENKIWHAHPVWFINDNPVVGYSKLKNSVQLLFWSGQSFNEEGLKPIGKFKAAAHEYNFANQISSEDLLRWLKKAEDIQWDYKNLIKNNGELKLLK